MNSGKPPVRIAHAYGNDREELRRALAAPIDIIEADIWLQPDNVWIRHERRLGPIPLLADRRMPGHFAGGLALPIWPSYYVRPDLNPLSLDELLDTAIGKRRLLLDAKGGDSAAKNDTLLARLGERLSQPGVRENVALCGQNWTLLSRLRELAPKLEVRFTIQTPRQWETFRGALSGAYGVRQVCMERLLMGENRMSILEEEGIDVYCWTVDDSAEATRLLAAGVDGIISNNLGLLSSLERSPAVDG